MFYPGLTRRFKVNRPLTNDEKRYHLKQSQHSSYDERELIDDMSFIKLNSTFLEVSDPYYKDRGGYTLVSLLFIGLLLYGTVLAVLASYRTSSFNDLYYIYLALFREC